MSEVIEPDMSADEARVLTDSIRRTLEGVWPLFVRAYQGRAWKALGYESWERYCSNELGGLRPPIESREQRREIVGEMRQAGMSQRGIADAVGLSRQAVRGDLQKLQNGEAQQPSVIQGSDGQMYPRARPSAPGPEPLPADPFEGWAAEEIEMRRVVEAGGIAVASLRGQHTRVIGWAEREGRYERIDRRTQWGNPFELPADGDRETVIRNYEEFYLPHKPSITVKLDKLRGRVLGCWCAPSPCHGDVLKRWAER